MGLDMVGKLGAYDRLNRFSWSFEAVETLRKLWGEPEHSARTIGEMLGCSANAVIGKAHRLGLSAITKELRAQKSRAQQGMPTLTRRYNFVKPLVENPTYQPLTPAPVPLAHTTESLPEALWVKPEDLAPNGCTYPMGDPFTDEFRYCGLSRTLDRNKRLSAYCTVHHKLTHHSYAPQLNLGPSEYRRGVKKRTFGY